MNNNYRYYEIEPEKCLRKYISAYWVIKNVRSDDAIEVFPDGCFDMVIYIDKHANNTIYITGIWSEKIVANIYKDVDVVGVRFQPSSIDVLFDINVNQLNNMKQEFSKSMLKMSDEVDLSILYHSKSIDEIISFYNYYFKYIIEKDNYHSVFDYICFLSENYTVNEFATIIGISERQLLREYRDKLGITTKMYLSIMRFIKAKNMLINGVNHSDIVYECGYSDESHFIKDFKKYTSYAPKDFLNHV